MQSGRRIGNVEQEQRKVTFPPSSVVVRQCRWNGEKGSNEEARPRPWLYLNGSIQSANWSGIEEVRQYWGGAKERGARLLGAHA